jgi:nicotinamide-nucleotide amidase
VWPELTSLAARVGERLLRRGGILATAESCTGGLIAAACTEIPGSSEWFDCAVVSYTLDAKTRWLGVEPALLERHGAVSAPTAAAMVRGVLARSRATHAVSVTGVAGPAGGEPTVPIGSVWLAWAVREGQTVLVPQTALHRFEGDRHTVRQAAAVAALEGILRLTE